MKTQKQETNLFMFRLSSLSLFVLVCADTRGQERVNWPLFHIEDRTGKTSAHGGLCFPSLPSISYFACDSD